MRWVEVSVSASPAEVEGMASMLGRYVQGGAVIEEWPSDISSEKAYRVKVYLPHSRSYKSIRNEIEQNLSRVQTSVDIQERLLKPEDWFNSLRKHFGILEIGEKFIIKPGWICQPIPVSTRIVIDIEPGAAFGTGLHPTTRLCLLYLEKLLQPGMSVLDLGTGSGILSIAAVKLGASSALALDTDPQAVRAARENTRINGVDKYIRVRRGTLSLRARRLYRSSFDMALSNITARAISDLSEGFARVLKPGGILIVSGIHPQGLDEVLISLSLAGFKLNDVDRKEEWYVVTATKSNNLEDDAQR